MPDFSAQLEAIKAVIESLPDHGGKLDALEAIKTAIEALPNYGDKLTALENAIKALPNYSDMRTIDIRRDGKPIGEIRIIAEPLRMEGISRG